MRIRKRSIAALSNLSREKPEVSCSSRVEEQMIKEKDFLLPLVKAAMDVQARSRAQAEVHAHFGEKDGLPIAQIQSRPLHRWRNALLRCTTQSRAVQDNGEGDKLSHRWDGIIRKTGGDRFRLVTGEGGYDKKALDGGVGAAVKKQRSKWNCTKKYHANEERKISPKMKLNEEKADEDKEKVLADKKKVLEDDKKKVVEDNTKNMHAGSQCRRRNGRGWRCSERTLVGYHLCEHHLGKGRLRSINNTSAAKVVRNGKGAKFKDLKLIHAAAASASV